ncbi:hypothetical protein D3C85_1490810 [compost metagenome]
MIIEREIIDRDQRDACLLLCFEMLKLKSGHFCAEDLLTDFTAPIRFKQLLPLPVSADSRIPETARCNLVSHFVSLLF